MPVQSSSPTLVVLAAGASTRYGRLKQLDPLGPGGQALLDYALFDGAGLGYAPALLVVQEDKQRHFAAHLQPATAAGLDIRFAHQPMDLPGVLQQAPRGRRKPWGTGFAVLAAGERLDGSFAVCNADDFYGRTAFAAVAIALEAMATLEAERLTPDPAIPSRPDAAGSPGHNPARQAVPLPAVTVGYRLDATLSDSGGVSRGICEVGDDGTLHSLTEGLDLRRVGKRIRGRDPTGAPVNASPDALACTSLWGFPPSILGLLAERFKAFVATDPGPEREFYLTEAVNDLIMAGKVRCTVLPTEETWLGITFPDDRHGVAESLRKLVESGTYPKNLWSRAKPCPAKTSEAVPAPKPVPGARQ